jgi:16S rRNA (guanine527-N7)-methyltransferase
MGTLASALGVEVSTDGLRRLARFESLLRERAVPLGLVAESDSDRLRERHVLDCLRAVTAVRGTDTLAYDIGSGAGLPGLVVAVARPSLEVRLIEPRRSRVAFLELAIERLGLSNASILEHKVEDVVEPADLCFARAFAALPEAWSAAMPRLRTGGRLVYFAGARAPTPALPAGAVSVRSVETPVLESAGSLIIMTR